MSPRVETLKNIGPATARLPHEVAVHTADDPRRIGAVAACRRVKQLAPRQIDIVCLYALRGALPDVHWNTLPGPAKSDPRQAAAGPS